MSLTSFSFDDLTNAFFSFYDSFGRRCSEKGRGLLFSNLIDEL